MCFKTKKKLCMGIVALVVLLVAVLAGARVRVNASQKKEIIFVTPAYNCGKGERTFEIFNVSTNEFSSGGVWRGDYYHATKGWVSMLSNRSYPAGESSNSDVGVSVTEGIPAAAPSWASDSDKNFYLYTGWSGEYYYHVTAKANSAEFKYRFWATPNSTGEEGIFDSQQETGYSIALIPDPVAGYYYTIDNNSGKGSLADVSGADYSIAMNLSVDISDFGKYIHVKAISVDGALSEEYVAYLSPDSPTVDKQELYIQCGDGIAKVTATGATSGTTISTSDTTYGLFLRGETITITETTKSGGLFCNWTSNQNLKYLNNTKQTDSSAQFQMPNEETAVKANGTAHQTLSISCGKGIKKVTATGATSGTSITCNSATAVSGQFLVGETVTLTQEVVTNGEFSQWSSDRVVTYTESTMQTSKTAKITMPDAKTAMTADGKLFYYITVKAGTGVSNVSLGENSSATSVKEKYYEGDTFTAGVTPL